MILYIAEKPSLGKEIANHLGEVTKKTQAYWEVSSGSNIYTVSWVFGHIFELEPPDYYIRQKTGLEKNPWSMEHLPVLPSDYKRRCNNTKQFALLRGFIKKSREIVNAGDPDREGQLLIDEVLQEAGLNPSNRQIKRIWLNALDSTSVQKAIANLKSNAEFENLRFSALARQHCDYNSGFNLTRGYTLTSGSKDVVRVGRVKSPTLAMVVRRDLEIENFVRVKYYVPYVTIKSVEFKFKKLLVDVPQGSFDQDGRIVNKELAINLLNSINKGLPWTVQKSSSEDDFETAPLPHSLDSLQSHMNKLHSLSASEVLSVAQSLYETHKLTTYPRSDCRYLPTSMHQDATRIANSVSTFLPQIPGFDLLKKSKCFNDSKVTAHHAIIPTGIPYDPSSLSANEKLVFAEISKFYLAQFCPQAQYKKMIIELNFSDKAIFTNNESILIEKGWKRLLGDSSAPDASTAKP